MGSESAGRAAQGPAHSEPTKDARMNRAGSWEGEGGVWQSR